MHIAENSVFIAIATILCMFRVSKSVDEQGKVVEPVVEYDGFIRFVFLAICNTNPEKTLLSATRKPSSAKSSCG